MLAKMKEMSILRFKSAKHIVFEHKLCKALNKKKKKFKFLTKISLLVVVNYGLLLVYANIFLKNVY